MSIFNEHIFNATNLTVSKRNRLFAEQNLEALKEEAIRKRRDSLQQADTLWEQAANRFRSAGVQVVFAKTAREANEAVSRFLAGCRQAVKGKSLTTEETGLRQALISTGMEVVETDLGEWIIQQRNELPAHFTAPAIHLSAGEVADMIHERFGEDLPPDPHALAGFARRHLRKAFLSADAGIIGANVVVANPGLIVAVSNEGNVSLSARLPARLVVFTGWDRIMDDTHGLEGVVRLLTASATGQAVTSYLDFLGGPLPHQEMMLVVLDNGRKELLSGPFSDAGRCIRCGACLNICPVYQEVGGHTFGKVYHGGIGALLTAFTGSKDDAGTIASYCLRCGSCEPMCPMEIPIATLVARLSESFPLPAYLKWPLKRMGARQAGTLRESKAACEPADTSPADKCSGAAVRTGVFVGCAFRTPFLKRERRGILSAVQRLWPDAVTHDTGCCGMPHFYKGMIKASEERGQAWVSLFEGCDTVLLPCSSGFSFLQEQTGMDVRLLSMEMARRLDPMDTDRPVFYHQPCHLKAGPGMEEKAVLATVIPFREWRQGDRCCGSAGTFFVSHPRISRKILDRKSMPAKGRFVILTSCPSCLLQLRRLFGRERVRHPVAWLAEHHPFFR